MTVYKDPVPKILKNGEEEENEDVDERQRKIEETTRETKAALDNVRLSAAQPKNVPTQSSDPKFIKYKPSHHFAAFNSGAKERIIRIDDRSVDPLEPPKFKHKKVPRASGSPPVTVTQSPPQPVTVKDLKDWNIPPCISNWKNPKGYTIPLDKRLATDGRGLQEVKVNDCFPKLSEVLYVAEVNSREAIDMRAKILNEKRVQEKRRRDEELCNLAKKARSERSGAPRLAATVAPGEKNMLDADDTREEYEYAKEGDGPRESKEERKERRERDKICIERKRERKLETKDSGMRKKSKSTRDRDRDISEKVALGMASTTGGRGSEAMYDQRLFNQDKGNNSGFAADEEYSVYDKYLNTAQATLSTLYRPKKDTNGKRAVEQLEKTKKTDRFKPNRAFEGTKENTGPRDRPVEFEEAAEEDDPFGLDQFVFEVNKVKKAMNGAGS